MKKRLLILMVLTFNLSFLLAQDKKSLSEKPGTFNIKKQALNQLGPDLYGKSCNYTNADSDAALKKLDDVVNIFRQTEILAHPRGFDGIAEIIGGRFNSKFGYGVPSTVYFYFKTWSVNKGKEVQWTVEPPQFRFEINMTEKFCSQGFNVSNHSDAYSPTNPAFTPEKANKTTIALRELFFLPGVRQTIAPGTDRYGDIIILFNHNRPAYWEQVTIREVYTLLLDYWKAVPDKIQSETMVPILEKEWANFSEQEKDGFAYLGNPETIFRIGKTKNETPVMRPNPNYWNRELPKSSIQFIQLEIPERGIVKQKMESKLNNADGYYYVWRLLYELNLNLLHTVIE